MNQIITRKNHSVEKIGGTSMSDYAAIRDNIILKPVRNDTLYQRVFVVSAYGGITDGLLEQKKLASPVFIACLPAAWKMPVGHRRWKI